MSHRFEFVTEIDAAAGSIPMPAEIASRLRLKGIGRVHVVVTSVAAGQELLAARGIDDTTIDAVAAAQGFDRDIAAGVLSGEGLALGTELGPRLTALLP